MKSSQKSSYEFNSVDPVLIINPLDKSFNKMEEGCIAGCRQANSQRYGCDCIDLLRRAKDRANELPVTDRSRKRT